MFSFEKVICVKLLVAGGQVFSQGNFDVIISLAN